MFVFYEFHYKYSSAVYLKMLLIQSILVLLLVFSTTSAHYWYVQEQGVIRAQTARQAARRV